MRDSVFIGLPSVVTFSYNFTVSDYDASDRYIAVFGGDFCQLQSFFHEFDVVVLGILCF